MLIGIISDTHNNTRNISNALDFLLERGITTVFHCGDWTKSEVFKFTAIEAHKRGQSIWGVLGNNDQKYKDAIYRMNTEIYMKVVLPNQDKDYLVYEYKKRKFGLFHGDDKKRLEELLRTENFEAVFIGHTHIPKEEYILSTKVLNPGSLSFSIPFKKKEEELYTVGIYDLNKKRFEVYEI